MKEYMSLKLLVLHLKRKRKKKKKLLKITSTKEILPSDHFKSFLILSKTPENKKSLEQSLLRDFLERAINCLSEKILFTAKVIEVHFQMQPPSLTFSWKFYIL